jgi:hypothetical protein
MAGRAARIQFPPGGGWRQLTITRHAYSGRLGHLQCDVAKLETGLWPLGSDVDAAPYIGQRRRPGAVLAMDRQFSGVDLSRGNASRIAAKKSFMESHPQPRELIALHFWLSSNHDARAAMLADLDLPDFGDQGFCLRIAHPNSIQQGHSAAWLTDGLERHGQSPLAG